MGTRHSIRVGLLGATAICAAGLIHRTAGAQTTATQTTATQIGSIEKQIRALQGQLDHMKHDLSARATEVKAARQEAAAASRQAREAQERFGPIRYDGNGHPLAPPPLAAPPGFGAAQFAAGSVSPFINTGGGPGFTPSGPKLKQGQFALGGVRVTLGGFIEAAGIFRSRNEVADISSSFNSGIPFPQSANYHQDEFRGSSRQSRISLLVEGSPNSVTQLAGYYEADFNSSGVTSNSVESNSYTLRARQLYATYARSDLDLYVLGGQIYTLATMNRIGIVPHQENTPLQIDAQFLVGFVWKRQVGLRVVKGFDGGKFNLGASVESPESTYFVGPNGDGTAAANTTNPGTNGGGATLNSSATYSTEFAPDIIVKATADPGYGHYELFGLARFLHDRTEVVGSGASHTVLGGGVGAGAILPLIPKKLDFQLSGLFGEGIGTYGAAQLTDATLKRDGSPQPLPEAIALAGLIYRPIKPLDLYGYVGTEQVTHREQFTIGAKGYGYGSQLYVNSGCTIELSPLACTANTSSVVEATGGAWYRFFKGDYGTLQAGVQYAFVKRLTYGGIGGSPNTNENIVMTSFRYLPFQ